MDGEEPSHTPIRTHHPPARLTSRILCTSLLQLERARRVALTEGEGNPSAGTKQNEEGRRLNYPPSYPTYKRASYYSQSASTPGKRTSVDTNSPNEPISSLTGKNDSYKKEEDPLRHSLHFETIYVRFFVCLLQD